LSFSRKKLTSLVIDSIRVLVVWFWLLARLFLSGSAKMTQNQFVGGAERNINLRRAERRPTMKIHQIFILGKSYCIISLDEDSFTLHCPTLPYTTLHYTTQHSSMWSSLARARVVQGIRASNTRSALAIPTIESISNGSNRTYVSRAHPRPTPELAVNEAMDNVLADIRLRRRHRATKFKRNVERASSAPAPAPAAAAADTSSTSDATTSVSKAVSKSKRSHPDETIELSLNLNLDPRKPGQALRGSLSLPHGTGKIVRTIVFTNDADLQEAAMKQGALHAGGDSLIEQVLQGEVSVDSFDRAVASSDMMPTLSKKVARLLGPRGLMPNAKVGTLVAPDELLTALETQLTGKELQFRTEKEGIVHLPVGKGSFSREKLLENIGQVMKVIFENKPESFGKGKKSGSASKGTKYLMKAGLSSTQGIGVRLDLRTVDPTSAFFLKSVDGDEEDDDEEAAADGGAEKKTEEQATV
jgi:large subunit ribosomal protein L1